MDSPIKTPEATVPLTQQTIITKAAFTVQEFADATIADPAAKADLIAWFSTLPVKVDLLIVTKL